MTVEFTSPTITFLEPGMAMNFEIELELELPVEVTLEANLGVTVSTTHGTGVGNASMFFQHAYIYLHVTGITYTSHVSHAEFACDNFVLAIIYALIINKYCFLASTSCL